MMKKVVICRGLPASGKTTWAKRFAERHPDTWIRLNMDDIRNMMGKYWVDDREPLVRSIFDRIYKECLMNKNYNIILDNTNLAESSLMDRELDAENFGFEVYEKDFNLSEEECIRRDKIRNRKSLCADVISDMSIMYLEDGKIKPLMPLFKDEPKRKD